MKIRRLSVYLKKRNFYVQDCLDQTSFSGKLSFRVCSRWSSATPLFGINRTLVLGACPVVSILSPSSSPLRPSRRRRSSSVCPSVRPSVLSSVALSLSVIRPSVPSCSTKQVLTSWQDKITFCRFRHPTVIEPAHMNIRINTQIVTY